MMKKIRIFILLAISSLGNFSFASDEANSCRDLVNWASGILTYHNDRLSLKEALHFYKSFRKEIQLYSSFPGARSEIEKEMLFTYFVLTGGSDQNVKDAWRIQKWYIKYKLPFSKPEAIKGQVVMGLLSVFDSCRKNY